jgi:hypothetical protein
MCLIHSRSFLSIEISKKEMNREGHEEIRRHKEVISYSLLSSYFRVIKNFIFKWIHFSY